MILAWVGGSDDGADGLLVEAFETTVALKVLEVTAQRAFLHELVKMLPCNQAVG